MFLQLEATELVEGMGRIWKVIDLMVAMESFVTDGSGVIPQE